MIDWVCLSEEIKENNNECMKELCKEQYNLYEKQNDLKGQKEKIEKLLER